MGGGVRDGRKVKEANKDTDPRKEKRVTDKLEGAEKKRRQEIYRFRAKMVCGPCCRDVVHGGERSIFLSCRCGTEGGVVKDYACWKSGGSLSAGLLLFFFFFF